jgi:glyoxylase-like metal-dependent hydrolase (beta-lactamase superfamily II)
MSDPFDRSYSPVVGKFMPLGAQIGVVTAPNPGPMTFTGTQTYLIGTQTLAIVDPGPENEAHFQALLSAINGRPVSHILVTHSHIDHSPLSGRLSHALDAPILAFGNASAGRTPAMERLSSLSNLGGSEGIDLAFAPDQMLQDGETIIGEDWTFEAIHTPGHLSNHLCFALQGTGAVFSGDHVMGWATTMVSPPDGDLTSYMLSMDKMAARNGDTVYYPGHGGAILDPMAMVRHQIAHRKSRESQILLALQSGPACSPSDLARSIYTDVDQRLIPAAARNVFAHLIDLTERDLVQCEGAITPSANFSLK